MPKIIPLKISPFLATAILLCFSHIAHSANNEDAFIAPLVKDSLLLDIIKSDDILVVGERGHVLRSDMAKDANSQSVFDQMQVPTKTSLTAVYKKDNYVWAVGHDASILKSNDGGNTWRLVQYKPELDRPFLDVYFFDSSEGIAIGAYGLFYRSIDAGETWQQEAHPTVLSPDDMDYLESIKDDEAFYLEELSFISPHLNSVSQYQNAVYIAGESGLIAKSTDQGRTWRRLDIDYAGSFFDVQQINEELVVAAGLRGNVFVNVDDDWQRIPSCLTTSLNAIVLGTEVLYLVGNNGVVLSLKQSLLESDDLLPPNDESCEAHVSVTQIKTNFTDAILNAILLDDADGQYLLAATAGGLKTIRVGE